jgi:nitroreductase
MTDPARTLRQVLAERFGEDLEVPEGLAGLDELLRIATHATHRSWSPAPVDPALVKLLAACALCAPSKSFLQQSDIVDVRDPATREAVTALVPSMPWMRDAPALLVFCGNGRRFRRIFERRGEPFVNEHLDGFFNPAVDAALVMMNFIRAASAAGLVCCPISVLRDRAARLSEILRMPDHVFPVAGLCVGWPAQARTPIPRLPLNATLHVDRFDDVPDDAAVDAALDDFDRRYVASRSRLPGASPAAPPASWTDEKAKQYATTQRADWGEFVRGKGFDPS